MADSSSAMLTVEQGVGIIAINSPPVNALGVAVRRALDDGFRCFSDDPAVEAIVLICEGRTFFAGADISEFGKPPQPPSLDTVFDIIENGDKPVVAAMHGSALGGGFEMALMCHYRLAVPSTNMGLPEVKLGIMPGAGGTQRLPRIIGVEAALELITSGDTLPAQTAFELGLIDLVAPEGKLREAAIAFARSIIGKPFTRARDRCETIAAARREPDLFSRFRAEKADAFRGRRAPENIIRAIEASLVLPFEAGLALERDLLAELRTFEESRAMSYFFFAQRECAKHPLLRGVSAEDVGSGLVVGSPILADPLRAMLERAGVRLKHAVGDDDIPASDADIVFFVPSAQESFDSGWASVFSTSSRDAAVLAIVDEGTSAPDAWQAAQGPRAIGLRMPPGQSGLLEIGFGSETHASTLASAVELAKRAKIVPLVCQSLRPSVCARLDHILRETVATMVRDGVWREVIEGLLFDFGFPLDGKDIAEDLWVARMLDPAVAAGWTAQLLYPVVNEAYKLVEEGVVLRASDVDVAAVLGCGWPVQKGGPLFWADGVGLASILSELEQASRSNAGLTISKLLREKAMPSSPAAGGASLALAQG